MIKTLSVPPNSSWFVRTAQQICIYANRFVVLINFSLAFKKGDYHKDKQHLYWPLRLKNSI